MIAADEKLSPRELIDKAREALGISSLYALAAELDIPAGYMQRYYRKNRIPLPVRSLIIRAMTDG